jgi:hypothetical protein
MVPVMVVERHLEEPLGHLEGIGVAQIHVGETVAQKDVEAAPSQAPVAGLLGKRVLETGGVAVERVAESGRAGGAKTRSGRPRRGRPARPAPRPWRRRSARPARPARRGRRGPERPGGGHGGRGAWGRRTLRGRETGGKECRSLLDLGLTSAQPRRSGGMSPVGGCTVQLMPVGHNSFEWPRVDRPPGPRLPDAAAPASRDARAVRPPVQRGPVTQPSQVSGEEASLRPRNDNSGVGRTALRVARSGAPIARVYTETGSGANGFSSAVGPYDRRHRGHPGAAGRPGSARGGDTSG